MPVFRRRSCRAGGGKGLGGALLSEGLSARLLATDPILLPVGTSGRLRVNRLDDTAPPPHWTEPDSHDSHWAQGRSGLGTGLGNQAPLLAASHPISACFRTMFVLEDPAAVQWLLLRLDITAALWPGSTGTKWARQVQLRGSRSGRNRSLPQSTLDPGMRPAASLDPSAPRHQCAGRSGAPLRTAGHGPGLHRRLARQLQPRSLRATGRSAQRRFALALGGLRHGPK